MILLFLFLAPKMATSFLSFVSHCLPCSIADFENIINHISNCSRPLAWIVARFSYLECWMTTLQILSQNQVIIHFFWIFTERYITFLPSRSFSQLSSHPFSFLQVILLYGTCFICSSKISTTFIFCTNSISTFFFLFSFWCN